MSTTNRTGKSFRTSEAHIEQTCTEILEWDGWRSFKMERNFSEKKSRAFGEVGMPDRLYIRYLPQYLHERGTAEVMWIEWKALDGKISHAQSDWRVLERKRGALVLCADFDFPPSIEGFRMWYTDSGLQRRR